ncbi:MAG: hypothetical protein HC920_12105 [Oscillatoriales cyanobacterium SM2_3_0]|nr:hypothetical protein [Oscillatoriales cyanobacterium SM2_3_0]
MSISRAGSTGDHQNSFQNHFQNNFDAFGMPAVDFSLTAGVSDRGKMKTSYRLFLI